jgi:hypothetical protein
MTPAAGTKLVRESEIEAYLDRQVRKAGGITRKWVCPGRIGVPDRIVICKGHVEFVEVKSPTGKTTVLQEKGHAALRAHGVGVYVVSTKEEVDLYVEGLGK